MSREPSMEVKMCSKICPNLITRYRDLEPLTGLKVGLEDCRERKVHNLTNSLSRVIASTSTLCLQTAVEFEQCPLSMIATHGGQSGRCERLELQASGELGNRVAIVATASFDVTVHEEVRHGDVCSAQVPTWRSKYPKLSMSRITNGRWICCCTSMVCRVSGQD